MDEAKIEEEPERYEKTLEESWSSLRGWARSRGIEFPRSYDARSPINIAGAGGVVDTSDRSFIKTWRRLSGRWDPDELRHDLLYLTPYVSCGECNGLIFIDAQKLRASQSRHISESESMRLSQRLEACPGCGTTVKYKLGAHDLLAEIASSKAELLRKLRRRREAARQISQCYRWTLRRREGRARRSWIRTAQILINASATKIAAGGRGRLGRRKALTCGCLALIAETHPTMIKRAITGEGWPTNKETLRSLHTKKENTKESRWPAPRRRVFWYKNPKQLKLLHYDYLQLCKRLGYVPPRFVVESNIHEIARRIRDRMKYLIGNVQARWRGISVRQLISLLIRERRRCLQVESAAAFRLTRLIRGWMARSIFLREYRTSRCVHTIGQAYRNEQGEKIQKRHEIVAKAKLAAIFSRDRAQEKTARYAGLVRDHTKASKMLAFRDSAYCDNALDRAATNLLARVNARASLDTASTLASAKRRHLLTQRSRQDSAYALYYKQELDDLDAKHKSTPYAYTNKNSTWTKERQSSRLAAAKAALSPKLQRKYGLSPLSALDLDKNASASRKNVERNDDFALSLLNKLCVAAPPSPSSSPPPSGASSSFLKAGTPLLS